MSQQTPPGTPLAAGDPNNPAWLKPRLEQQDQSSRSAEREAILKELGVKDLDTAKKALTDGKTASEKLAEQAARDAEERTKKDKETAERMLIGLTDAQKAAVKDLAGDDPKEQVKVITKLTPTWAKEEQKPPGGGTQPPATPPPAVPPATTAPPPNAPAGGGTTPPNHKAVYQEMRKQNPWAAAHYGEEHPEVFDIK